jgi:glycosyltransferase involved in cell wall biosynthesis
VRALIVSNMKPDEARPELGRFVRDQVAALRRLDDLEVELFEFPPGPRALAQAVVELRRLHGGPSTLSRRPAAPRWDVVHAHFGLSAWPALAAPARVRALTVHGRDVYHQRTRLATGAVLPFIDLLAAVSATLAEHLPGRAARRRAVVLPCGIDLERFRPIERAHARAELGLDPQRPYLLFVSHPSRADKRHDRALAVAESVGVELLTLGHTDPALVPLWINASNAVLVPSDREGFGLAALEALACDVPVLATPVGIAPDALQGVDGALCAPFDLTVWTAALQPHLQSSDPRVNGRLAVERFSALAMAERVRDAWRGALERSG